MQRKQIILERLEREREMRRQHIRDGTIDQFQLEDFSDVNNQSDNYYQNEQYEENQMSEMKDPSQILLLEPQEEEEMERYSIPQAIYENPMQDNQYTSEMEEHKYPEEVQPYPYEEENMDYNAFGYNPENLYDPTTMQSLEYSDANKENMRNEFNTKSRKVSFSYINFTEEI